MTGGLEIRRATEKDLAEVVLLERETSTSPHWAWAEYAGMQRTGHSGGVRRCLFVAADGRNLHGFAVGKALGHGADTQAELESVVVRSEDRREGIGSALCRAVMDWSRREGAHEITLEVRASSSGAIRLYGGLGFVAVGRRPAYYHEPPEDAVIMHCFLAGSSPVITHHMNGQAELF
jgi:[ribosomal protein S18]-alanine N-acetyltransferase